MIPTLAMMSMKIDSGPMNEAMYRPFGLKRSASVRPAWTTMSSRSVLPVSLYQR